MDSEGVPWTRCVLFSIAIRFSKLAVNRSRLTVIITGLHECGQILSAGDLILFMVVFMQTINQNQQADYAGNGGADCCRFVAEKNLAKGGKVRKTLPAKC